MQSTGRDWFDRLTDEDRTFLKRFVLAGGSLKDLAAEYRVSYPTIRLRMDRLIEKVRLFDSLTAMSEFERQVRALYAEGRIDLDTLKRLLEAHRLDQLSRNGAESEPAKE